MPKIAIFEPMDNDTERDHQEIRAVIAAECEAYYRRDHKAWSEQWLHHDGVNRMCVVTGGHPDYRVGWDAHSQKMKEVYKDHPTPNLTAGQHVRRENIRIRISGDMAWVTFDQITQATDDPLINVGVSREMRVFERHGGKWLHAFISNQHSLLPAISSPTIALNAQAEILWMNQGAEDRLPGFAVLKIVNAKLFTHSRHVDREFHQLLAEVANYTMVDLMWASRTQSPGNAVDHFLIEDPTEDRVHVLWVRKREDMVLVSFDHPENLLECVSAAQSMFGLSKSQSKLAFLIANGHDIPSAAQEMNVSVNTAKTHLTRVYEKMRVSSQASLVRELMRGSQPIEQ